MIKKASNYSISFSDGTIRILQALEYLDLMKRTKKDRNLSRFVCDAIKQQVWNLPLTGKYGARKTILSIEYKQLESQIIELGSKIKAKSAEIENLKKEHEKELANFMKKHTQRIESEGGDKNEKTRDRDRSFSGQKRDRESQQF